MLLKIFIPLFITSLTLVPQINRKYIDSTTIDGSGDVFSLTDVNYASDESFVYTSTANFESGQACGLVFGALQDEHYWVFNVDRYENRTKLLYFSRGHDTQEVRWDYLIGNDKTTQSEFNLINPKVRENQRFDIKIVVSVSGNHRYAEFFIDNIKRFGVDSTIDLNDYSYEGGYLGYNVFNSKTNFTNTTYGRSDYTYYTELYRNQYHYSQFSHWNNDPNGLVYYDGWYHLYYQTNPFDKHWADMYWGHARSRDLIHWQELPIALFPDDGTMDQGLGNGYAWSGIAMVYHRGMSQEIDNRGWFGNDETGLLGYFTRDGERQDQVIIVSRDGGITWEKKWLISQHLCVDGRKADCRDPSIFEMKKVGDKVTLWGMVLSGGNENKVWYLKSEDMVNWSFAGEFDYIYPECVTVKQINGGHYVMSISSRHYALGDFYYNESSGMIEFHNLSGNLISQSDFVKMDYGEDSYAAQCFYIDDPLSKYFGKAVSISWFSGLPSDAESDLYANARDPWNGGMTIPVVLGIKDNVLTQTPITRDNDDEGFESDVSKKSLFNISGFSYDSSTNLLNSVNAHTFELEADITNEDEADIEFKVLMSDYEYTSFGWNKREGYYVDRNYTYDADIDFHKNYHHRFTTGPTGNNTHQTFYVLADNGSLEVFCGEFKYSFYNLVLPGPCSNGFDFIVFSRVQINSLCVNSIKSTWRDTAHTEGTLIVPKNSVDLDSVFKPGKEVIVYSTNGDDITWNVTSGAENVNVIKTPNGLYVTPTGNGQSVIEVSANEMTKIINVSSKCGNVDCFYDLKEENINSGSWYVDSYGLVGNRNDGDGFILSDDIGSDFVYSASFDVSNSAAAGLLFRATNNMSSYIMANYDKNAGICKVWSYNGESFQELANVGVNPIDINHVTLQVTAYGRNVKVALDGNEVINVQIRESDPLSGHYGLNVFSGTAHYLEIKFSYLAMTFAEKLLELTNEACEGNYSGTIDKSAQLHSIWLTLQNDYYSKMNNEQKQILVTAEFDVSGAVVTPLNETNQTIAEAMARYEMLVTKYGGNQYDDNKLTDFISRGVTPIQSQLIDLLNDNGSINIALIVVIVSSLAAISALSTLILKKKKEH